jgi:hypothetical protein
MPTLPTRDLKVQVHTPNFCVVIKTACNEAQELLKSSSITSTIYRNYSYALSTIHNYFRHVLKALQFHLLHVKRPLRLKK